MNNTFKIRKNEKEITYEIIGNHWYHGSDYSRFAVEITEDEFEPNELYKALINAFVPSHIYETYTITAIVTCDHRLYEWEKYKGSYYEL